MEKAHEDQIEEPCSHKAGNGRAPGRLLLQEMIESESRTPGHEGPWIEPPHVPVGLDGVRAGLEVSSTPEEKIVRQDHPEKGAEYRTDKKQKSFVGHGRKHERQQRPQNPAHQTPPPLAHTGPDIEGRYRRGIDIQKCGGKSGKKDDDHGGQCKAKTHHQFQHHAFRCGGLGRQGRCQTDGVHPGAENEIAHPSPPESGPRAFTVPRIVTHQGEPANGHGNDQVQAHHEGHPSLGRRFHKTAHAVFMKHHIGHDAAEADQSGHGDPLEPFPVASPQKRPEGGSDTSHQDPASKPEGRHGPNRLGRLSPNPQHDAGPPHQLYQIEDRCEVGPANPEGGPHHHHGGEAGFASHDPTQSHGYIPDEVPQKDHQETCRKTHGNEKPSGPDLCQGHGGPGPEKEEIHPAKVSVLLSNRFYAFISGHANALHKKSHFLSKKKSGSKRTTQHESYGYFTTVPLPFAGITQFRF